MLKYILDRLGLTLNETKTKVVNAWDESFDFLGFEVRMHLGRSRKAYPHSTEQAGSEAYQREADRFDDKKPDTDSITDHC